MNKFYFFLLSSLLFFFSCSRHHDDYLARVGRSFLTKEDLAKMLPDAGLNPNISKNNVNSVVSSWVKKEVLFQQARSYHFDRDENIRARVNDFYRDLVIDAFIKYYLQTNVAISEDEIRNYYLQNKNSFIRDREEARVTHVIVQDFNDAMAIKTALASHNKAELDKFLQKYNFETKTVRRGESLSELDRTIFETSPRNILGPIATNYGYHIVEVLARFPVGSVRSLDEVRDDIYQKITQMKIQANYDRLLDSLLKDADYEIRDDNITNFLSKQQ